MSPYYEGTRYYEGKGPYIPKTITFNTTQLCWRLHPISFFKKKVTASQSMR